MSTHGSDRQPRRGDIVQAAPHFKNGVCGTVVGISQGRMSIETPNHGKLQLPMNRFTWKPKARVWICWPPEMVKHIKTLDAADEAHQRARYGITPCVGDCVNVDGKIGWITAKTASRVQASVAEGALFRAIMTYRISLADGAISVEEEKVTFDSQRKLWAATRE